MESYLLGGLLCGAFLYTRSWRFVLFCRRAHKVSMGFFKVGVACVFYFILLTSAIYQVLQQIYLKIVTLNSPSKFVGT